MNAYVLHGVNDLRYEEVDIPPCPEGWAVVRVKAAGICSSDIPRIYTKGTYHFPTIPGHELSGDVCSVGSEVDKDWIGKRVGIFPLIPCKKCPQCDSKHYEMCLHYDYVGSRRNGGFAEYVSVPVWNLILLPDSMSYITAAMLEPLSVALHAMRIGDIKPSDNVGIIGTGMIGISAAQWAKMMGAGGVTIIGRNEAKRQIVEEYGVEYRICKDSDTIGKFDIVLEAVGTISAIEQAIRAAIPGGTVILLGNPVGDIILRQDVYWLILRKQLRVLGTWNSFYDGKETSDWINAVAAITERKVNVQSLVTHTYPQDELLHGLELMRDHSEPYCKVMTIWNE